MSLGKSRIRVNFNPSEKKSVASIKELCADVIDKMEDYVPETIDGEHRRLVALGHTKIEEAAMHYVKALT